MSSKKRAIVRMEGKKYEEMKKLEKKHIRERSSIRWREASVATDYVESNVKEMEERQNQYKELVNNLSGDMALIEEQTQNKLLEQEISFLNQLNAIEYEMNLSTEDLLRQQSETFDCVIHEVQSSYNTELDQLDEAVHQIQAGQQEKEQMSLRQLEDVDQIYEWIRSTYDWEFFKPGEMREIEHRIDIATENYYKGMTEASVAQSQSIQSDLIKTRYALEQIVSEWNLLRGMIDQRITQLELVIQESREVQPVDLEMNVIEDVDALDVNYWSQGRLVEVEEKLDHIKHLVQHDQCNQDIGQLQKILKHLGDEMDDRLSGIIMYARYNALDAQIRRNLATIAADVMTANGFQVVDYSDNVLAIQEPFFVLMQDDHGGEVKIDIAPEEGYVNNISIEMSESTSVMEFQLESQRRDVIDELNRRGVSVERLDQPGNSQRERAIDSFSEAPTTISVPLADQRPQDAI